MSTIITYDVNSPNQSAVKNGMIALGYKKSFFYNQNAVRKTCNLPNTTLFNNVTPDNALEDLKKVVAALPKTPTNTPRIERAIAVEIYEINFACVQGDAW